MILPRDARPITCSASLVNHKRGAEMMGSELKTARLCVTAAKLLSLGLLVSHSPARREAHVKAEGINLESNSGCSGSLWSSSVVRYMTEKDDAEEPRPTWTALTNL